MSAVPTVVKYSLQDYLKIEESTGKRYEFYDGELFEVEGASVEHNRIVAHTFGEVYAHLKGKSCEVFASQLKVESKLNDSVVYPDITIVCNGIELSPESKDIVTNPTVIIEVVSPSTGDYDHGEKFFMYRALPSLKEYILISSVKMLIEKFTKQNTRRWTMDDYRNSEDILTIDSIGLQLSLSEIYSGTDLPQLDD